MKYITIKFATEKKTEIHPQSGIPQLHYDQLCVINQHHHAARTGEAMFQEVDEGIPFHHAVMNKIVTKGKLTRNKLLAREDWPEWESSEFLQLDQYEIQEMFSKPTTLPNNKEDYNILPMIWNYLIKKDGKKKARCVADGSGKQAGTISLDHTYAACLDQSRAKMFWGLIALKNLKAFGADCSNAFAEAPPLPPKPHCT